MSKFEEITIAFFIYLSIMGIIGIIALKYYSKLIKK